MPYSPYQIPELQARANEIERLAQTSNPGSQALAQALGRIQVAEIGSPLREILRSEGIPGYKKGGPVKKTGIALVHRGEKIIGTKEKALLKKRK